VTIHYANLDTKVCDSTQPAYPCRFLNRCATTDFEAALERLVAELVARHPKLSAAGPNM
jgi:hypothetical protein